MAESRARGGMRFVGRQEELRVLDEALAEVAAGGAAAVAVTGEPGIGKTRLVAELAARAEVAGFQVLQGSGSEFEQDVPFRLAIDALDEVLGSLDPNMLRRLGAERVAELAAIFPSLPGGGGRLSSSLEIERFRCHYAVRAVLDQLTRARPLLLVLDDLHWADPASSELVGHLLRRGVGSTLLVTAYRPATPPHASGCERAAREAGVRVLELGPLSVGDLAESLGDQPDSPRVRALYQESGGNPFYFTELAEAAAVPGAPPLPTCSETPGRIPVPSALCLAMDRELDALSAPARQLARAGAVTGEPFDIDLAAVVAELTDAEALIALDELIASEIVRPTGVPGRMIFRHPIVRRAVYDATGHGWRLGAHRRAAAELAARGGSLSARAHHVERSASQGDEQAITLLATAGKAAMSRAPAAAAHWFAGAVRLLPPATPPARRLDLLLPLAAAHAAAGHPRQSREALLAARAHIDMDDLAIRHQITTLLAATEQALGRSDQAKDLLTEALNQVAPGSAEAAALTIELATNHTVRGEWGEAVRLAEAAASVADQLGDRALVAAATVASGFALINVGESALDDARNFSQRAIDLFDGLPDDEVAKSHLSTFATLAIVETLFRDWTTAQRIAERGLRLCRESGRGDAFIPFMLVLSAAATMRGDLDEAGPLADAAVEAATLMDNDQWIAPTEAIRCWLLVQRGKTAEALAAGRNAVRAAERAPRSIFWWVARTFYATALIEAGQHERGREELYRVGGTRLSNVPPTNRPYWQAILITSYLATGELHAASELVELMERTESQVGPLLHSGEARRARACLLFATGRHASAAHEALKAAELYEAGEMFIDAARTRLLAGRALVASGATAAGERQLDHAHHELTRRGAARLADEAAKELRSLGRTVSQRSKPRGVSGGVESLSARELEVAERVAQGYTNREIARELFVSPKTVEAHLTRVYGKLGVKSRAAMAAILTRSHPK